MCIVQMIVERHRRREPRTAVQAERVTVGELGLALLFVEAWMRSIIAIGGDEGMHIYLSISGTWSRIGDLLTAVAAALCVRGKDVPRLLLDQESRTRRDLGHVRDMLPVGRVGRTTCVIPSP